MTDCVLATDLVQAAWEALGLPVIVADHDTRIVHANPAALTEFADLGLELGRPIELVPGVLTEDGTRLTDPDRPLRRALAGEVVHDAEFVLPATQRRPARRLVVSCHPFTGPQGATYALLTWRDVTSRWLAEENRRTTVQQLTALLQGADSYAIFMLGADGRVLTWSTSAAALHRAEEQDVLGKPFSIFFTPRDQAKGTPDAVLREAAETGRAVTEGERLRWDGTSFRARGVVTAQRDDEGRLTGFVKVSHDVTEEYLARQEVRSLNRELLALNHQLEQRIEDRTADLRHQAGELERQADELRSLNEELDAFSSSVSHDLHAPLRSMSGFARLLAEDHSAGLPPEARGYLARIQSSAVQMGELIDGLLALSRVQRHQVARDQVDMTAAARAAWELVAPHDAGTTFRLEGLPPQRGDRQLLTQVWVNLLENAVKFTRARPDPVIRVWAEPAQDGTAYCVRDNGAGFDQRYAGKLFQPFQRMHRAEDFPGTGIGLALVRRIVVRHGGSVEVTAAPGEGAYFRFVLPGQSPAESSASLRMT